MSFLTQYIETNNPEVEEILLDTELITELKFDQGRLKDFILQNINKIIDFLVVEPSLNSSSKRCFTLPHKACEVICNYNQSIAQCVLQDKSIFLERFHNYIKTTDKQVLLDSTLPTYGFKILIKLIKSNTEDFNQFLLKDEVENILFDCFDLSLYLDSSNDTLLILLANDLIKPSIFAHINRLFIKYISNCIDILESKNSSLSLELLLNFDSLNNISTDIIKILKILHMIEPDYNERESIISKLFSDENISLIMKYLNSVNENFYLEYIEVRTTINTLLNLISSFIINSVDIKQFNSEYLSNTLNIYMFDEIMDLDLIQEQKKDNSTDFQNNLNLSKEFSYSKVNKIIQFLSPSVLKVFNMINEIKDKLSYNSAYINKQDKIEIINKKYTTAKLFIVDLCILEIVFFPSYNINICQVDILFDIIKDFSFHHNNSFLLNKIVKLVDLLVNSNNSMIQELRNQLIKKGCFDRFLLFFKTSNFFTFETKTFNNCNYFIQNSAQVFQITKLIIENKSKFDEFIQIEADVLEKYNIYKIIQTKTLSQEKQNLSDIPIKDEDEEYKTTSSTGNSNDISKKVMEKAKGIKENLKNLSSI